MAARANNNNNNKKLQTTPFVPTMPVSTKLHRIASWEVLNQNCLCVFPPPHKIAARAKKNKKKKHNKTKLNDVSSVKACPVSLKLHRNVLALLLPELPKPFRANSTNFRLKNVVQTHMKYNIQLHRYVILMHQTLSRYISPTTI